MKLNLTRPIIFFDLETTGTSITRDRIVEISYIKVLPDGREIEETERLNPGMPIPAEATAVHHITNEDVADKPRFEQIADRLLEVFNDCDIAGFNSNRFDVPLLIEEFARAGKSFDLRNRRFVDVQNIFHKMEKRTLVAAYQFYCGKDLEAAHSANADTRATYEVLQSQLDRYPSLKNDVEALADFSKGSDRAVDLACRFVYNDQNVIVFNFGKFRGQPAVEVLRREPSYYAWMMEGDFPKNTKDVLTALRHQAMSGK